MPSRGGTVAIIVIVVVVSTVEITRPFMFVWTAMILVSANQVAHVGRRIFVEFFVISKNEYRDIDGTEDREFMRLLEQSSFSFQKRY